MIRRDKERALEVWAVELRRYAGRSRRVWRRDEVEGQGIMWTWERADLAS